MTCLVREVHRWESFSIHVAAEALGVALEMCCFPAPALKQLSVRCAEADALEDEFVLFDESTPLLRSVRLASVPVPWDGPLFDNLTVLELTHYDDDYGPSIEQLCSILRRSHGLRRLVLHRAGITTTQNSEGFQPTLVHMNSLEYVQMTDLDVDFFSWLTHVRAPKVHTVVASPTHDGSDTEELMSGIEMESHVPFPNVKTYRAQYGMF